MGTIFPVTGPLEIFGPDMRAAVDLAATEINDAGGVLGQAITIIHEDSSTDAQIGVTAAEKLINVDGAQAIIGAAANIVSDAVASITVPNQVVQISPSSTSPRFTTLETEEPGWFWRTAVSDALQGTVAALYAYHDKGWRSVAILTRADPYGSGLAQTFQDTFEVLGGTITQRVDYDITATFFITELTTIFNSNPEAVWWVGYPGEGGFLMQQWWANPAWRGLSWLWSEGTKDETFVENLIGQGIGVDGIEGTAPINGPNFETFRTAYLVEYGREPQVLADHAYDALYLAALAAVAREAVDSAGIRDSLIAVSNPPGTVVGPGPQEFARAVGILEAGGNIDYEGASGLVNFDLVGDVGSDYEIWNISPTGQIQQVDVVPEETVWPATPGTTAPIASFTVTPPTGVVTANFTVDASASSDLEDPVNALEVQFDWEDDGVWDTNWTGEKMAEHQYASSDTYTIRMRVRDAGTLMDSTTRQVEVASTPPETRDFPISPLIIAVGIGAVVAAVAAVAAFLILRSRGKRKGEV
ncbi:MAG: ABC transporter substrate-binding protein [Thermoplasmata archaeon]